MLFKYIILLLFKISFIIFSAEQPGIPEPSLVNVASNDIKGENVSDIVLDVRKGSNENIESNEKDIQIPRKLEVPLVKEEVPFYKEEPPKMKTVNLGITSLDDISTDSLLGMDNNNLQYINEMVTIGEFYKNQFDEWMRFKSKTGVVNELLDFYSDSNVSHYYNGYKHRFNDAISVFKNYYDKWISESFRVAKELQHINIRDVADLTFAASKSPVVRNAPVWHAMVKSDSMLGHALYGLAHSCVDLLYYLKSPHKTYVLEINRDETSYSSKKCDVNIILDGVDNKTDLLFDSPVYKMPSVMGIVSEDYSAMDMSKWSNLRDYMSGLDVTQSSINIEMLKEYELGQAAMGVTNAITGGLSNVSRAFKIQTSNVVGIHTIRNNRHLMDCIYALQFVYDKNMFNQTEREELIRYVYSQICLIIKNQIQHDSADAIRKLNLKITFDLTKIKDDRLSSKRELYNKDVNDGLFCPISTTQWLYYYEFIDIDSDLWRKSILLSVLTNISLNNTLLSIMPKIDDRSKRYFRMYATHRKLANPSSLMSISMPNLPKVSDSNVDWGYFMHELLARYVTIDGANKDMPLFTNGTLKFGKNMMDPINISREHPFLSSFAIKESKFDDVINNYVLFELGLTLKNGVIDYDVPLGVRKRTKFSNSPNIKMINRMVKD